jgi:hypothetical protein
MKMATLSGSTELSTTVSESSFVDCQKEDLMAQRRLRGPYMACYSVNRSLGQECGDRE